MNLKKNINERDKAGLARQDGYILSTVQASSPDLSDC